MTSASSFTATARRCEHGTGVRTGIRQVDDIHVLTPTITEAGKNYSYQAKIVFGADADASNNVSEAIAVQIPGNDLPKVTDLKGNMSDGKVLLTWSEPDMTKGGTVTDGLRIVRGLNWYVVRLAATITFLHTR